MRNVLLTAVTAFLVLLWGTSLVQGNARQATAPIVLQQSNPTSVPNKAQIQDQIYTLGTQGIADYNAENFERAITELKHVVDLSRSINDLNAQEVALIYLGRCYVVLAQYPEALDSFNQSLAIARALGHQDTVGHNLDGLGIVYTNLGQYAKALDYLNQALTIARKTGNQTDQGVIYNSLGVVYYNQGKYSAAVDSFNQALKLARANGDRRGQDGALINIGNMYYIQGQFGKALDAFNQSLTIAKAVKNQVDEAAALSGIAILYTAQGQYAKALNSFNQVMAIDKQIGDQDALRVILTAIGSVYDSEGQFTQGIQYFNQALTLARALGNHTGEAGLLNNIGSAYLNEGLYSDALDYLNQSLKLQREIGNRAGEGTVLDNIGLVYADQQKNDQALDYFNQAFAIHRESDDILSQESVLTSIGGTYANQGKYSEALDFLTQSLTLARKIGDVTDKAKTLTIRGSVYENLKQPENAIADYRTAVQLTNNILTATALDAAIASLSKQDEFTKPSQRLAMLLAAGGNLPDALNYAETGRAVLVRAELAFKPINFRAGLDQTLLNQEAALRLALNNAQAVLDALVKDPNAAADDIQKAQAALDQAHQAYDQQIETMQLKGGFLARQLSNIPAKLAEIQAAMPADTTLIEYVLGDKNSIAFLINNQTIQTENLNVTAEQVSEQVITFASDRRANAAALAKMSDMIFSPLADKLQTKHLIIVPDGALNYVPFAALQMPNGSYLIDQYAISYVPSATTYVLLKGRKPTGAATSPGLVLAQPSAAGLPTLQNSRTEANKIATILGVKPVLDASVADLTANATGAKVITISAHAELDLLSPLYSAIYLKPGAQSDGRFEVNQIYGLDLSHGTQLVVLSGCNTASGGNGEDFGTLTRAFFAAGTPRIVSSLWSVDDAATAFLISTYMAERARSTSEADALRAAMIATREQYPEPYYWASFVLSGLP